MLTLLSASLLSYLDSRRTSRMMTSTANIPLTLTTNMSLSVASNRLFPASPPSCPAL